MKPAAVAQSIFGDIAYLILAYLAIDFIFLKEEGILNPFLFVLFELTIVVLIILAKRYLPVGSTRKSKKAIAFHYALETIAFIVFFMILPHIFLNLKPEKGYSNLWYSMDWHRFWENWILVFKTSPGFFVCFITIIALLAVSQMSGRMIARIAIPCVIFSYFIFMMRSASVLIDSEQRGLSIFALPLVPAFALSLFKYNRAFSRLLIAGAMFSLVGFFYFGMLPIKYWFGPPVYPAFVERIYPARHGQQEVPLMFNREMFVQADGRSVFLSYGATCGLLKINPARKQLDGNIEVHGMMRKIWSSDETNYIFGLDDLYSDFYVFTKSPFKKIKTTDMFSEYSLISPFWFDMSPDMKNLYVLTYENSEVIHYSLNGFDLKKEKKINLKQSGLTDFSSGGNIIIYDKETDSLLVMAGIVSWKLDYMIAEIDAKTLRIKKTMRLPKAGLFLAYIPQTRSIFSSDFYGRSLYEVDRDTFKVRRIIKGPLSVRSLVYDARRNLIYTGSYAQGDIQIIDYRTGKLLRRIFIGPKVTTLFLAPDLDSLYIASGSGIFNMDLDAMSKEIYGKGPHPASAPGEIR